MTKLISGGSFNVEMSHLSTVFFHTLTFYCLPQFSGRLLHFCSLCLSTAMLWGFLRGFLALICYFLYFKGKKSLPLENCYRSPFVSEAISALKALGS